MKQEGAVMLAASAAVHELGWTCECQNEGASGVSGMHECNALFLSSKKPCNGYITEIFIPGVKPDPPSWAAAPMRPVSLLPVALLLGAHAADENSSFQCCQ